MANNEETVCLRYLVSFVSVLSQLFTSLLVELL